MPPRFRWPRWPMAARSLGPIDKLFDGAEALRPVGSSNARSTFITEEARALRSALDVFDAWSNRILSVCELHLRAENGETPAERATESLTTNHWLLPMLFSEVERQVADSGRQTLRALQSVKAAKLNVAPFLGPADQSKGHAQAFADAAAGLRAACERFRETLSEDIDRLS